MKKALFGIFILLSIRVIAQQDPQFSHYMFVNTSYNPAAAGLSGDVSVNLLNHNQWIKLEGAPRTNLFSVDAPLDLAGKTIGIGAMMMSDNYAFIQDMTFGLMFDYQIDMGLGKLSIGASASAFSKQFVDVDWKFPDQSEPIFANQSRSMVVDFNLGIFYIFNNLYTGLSITHITAPNFVFISEGGNEQQVGLVRHYYFTAGYNITSVNSLFDIRPSVLIKTDARQLQFDVNMMFLYNKKIWAGVSYRNAESIVTFLGTSYFKNIKLGLSYDIIINSINRVSNGTFEVYLGYNFSLLKMEKPQHYHNVKTL